MVTEQEVNFLRVSKPTDLGLSTADIETTRRTLQILKRHPDYPNGYDVKLKGVLDEQDRVASFREIEQRLKGYQIAMTRRQFGRLAVKALFWTAIGGTGLFVASAVNKSCFSPEAQAKNAEENRQAQEAKRQKDEQDRLAKIETENKRQLGLTPSAVSSKGFRIRYNPPDKNIKYVDIGDNYGVFTVAKMDDVVWRELEEGGTETKIVNTNITLRPYTRAQDGIIVPQATVRVSKNAVDTWYLRVGPAEDVDTSVVIFEHITSNKEYFLVVTPVDGKFDDFQFRMMKKEPIGR